jgi:hypothetical protein
MTIDEMKRVAFDYTRRAWFNGNISGELDRLRLFAITDEQANEIKATRDEWLRLEAEAKRVIQAKLAVQATPLELLPAGKEWPTPYVCVVVAGAYEAKGYKIKAEEFPWTPAQIRDAESRGLFSHTELKAYLTAKVKPFNPGCRRSADSAPFCMDGCTLFIV